MRKIKSYENYNDLEFSVPVGRFGDCYDRFLIRFEEINQSVSLVEQCLSLIYKSNVFSKSVNSESKSFNALEDYKLNLYSKSDMKKSMELTISHFKLFSEGFTVGEEDLYIASETPKGEFAVYMETDDSNKPYRCKIRAPGFFHLQALNKIVTGHQLADVVAIIGTLDIVFGEVDR